MMASSVSPPIAKVEGAEEEGGIVEVAGSIVSTRGRFGRS